MNCPHFVRSMKERLLCVAFTSLFFSQSCVSKVCGEVRQMCHDHAGKEFIIIPLTVKTSEIFQVHIASIPTITSVTSGNIDTPLMAMDDSSKISTSFSISPSSGAVMNIENFKTVPVNTKNNDAIVISTNNDVIVAVSSGESGSLGATLIFPTETLGTEYRIVTYGPNPPTTDRAVLAIGSIYPETEVRLFPGSEQVELEIDGTYYEGTATIDLNFAQYESIVITSTEDLTGIRVLATKPVAVFSGNVDLSLYNDGIADATFEQMPPVSELGLSHIIISNPQVQKDRIKIVSIVDKTELYLNDVQYNIMTAGNFLFIDLESTGSGSSIVMNSTNPVLVTLYGDKSKNFADVTSDVTMTIIPPVINYGTSFVLLPPVNSFPVNYTHYLMLISPQGFSSDFRIDGSGNMESLPWTPVTDIHKGISHEFLSFPIPESAHILVTVNDRHEFGGYLYGTAEEESYGIGLAAYTNNEWTVQGTFSQSIFSKIAEDMLPFPVALSKETTRSVIDCHQLCSLNAVCGLVAILRQSALSYECRFYELETQCGPFQKINGYKLFVREK